MAELRSYVLTMENVKRTYVTLFQIKRAVEKDPKLAKAISEGDDDRVPDNLSTMTRNYSSYPAVVAIIANNGFTPRQLVLSELTLTQVAQAAAAIREGIHRDIIIAENVVSAANLDFVLQHQAELDKMGRKYLGQ